MHFSITRLPRIEFGFGTLAKLPELIGNYGDRCLLVTGGHSLERSPLWQSLTSGLQRGKIQWQRLKITQEPSPSIIDEAVAGLRAANIDVVVGIGGGSVLDAAKAIAGLLKPGNSVMDHLEGVGPELPYLGPATPFIAIPTTAGTGSEATKNAVLSISGQHGFKKSFRDEKLVAQYAIIDPSLLSTCPKELIAANGMDAFTQLLESYVSLRANPFTDALALSGLRAVRDNLLIWFENSQDVSQAQGEMAYASLLSGITLAQVGLGSVHGLAAPLGAFFPIPHGIVCGTLVAEATRINIRTLQDRDPNNPALHKYAEVGRMLRRSATLGDEGACKMLVQTLQEWTERLHLPRLSTYGVRSEDFPHIVANCRGSSMKTNPILLTDSEVGEILWARL